MVQEKMKKAYDHQKSYVEFEEGDNLFLKDILKLGLKGFFKTKKLSLRCIGLYQIISRVGEVAYHLVFPPSIYRIHDVFHVSQLGKFEFEILSRTLKHFTKCLYDPIICGVMNHN